MWGPPHACATRCGSVDRPSLLTRSGIGHFCSLKKLYRLLTVLRVSLQSLRSDGNTLSQGPSGVCRDLPAPSSKSCWRCPAAAAFWALFLGAFVQARLTGRRTQGELAAADYSVDPNSPLAKQRSTRLKCFVSLPVNRGSGDQAPDLLKTRADHELSSDSAALQVPIKPL